ncbi:hypothetical protein ABZ769_33845 [Streptomyces olivoreticuli]
MTAPTAPPAGLAAGILGATIVGAGITAVLASHPSTAALPAWLSGTVALGTAAGWITWRAAHRWLDQATLRARWGALAGSLIVLITVWSIAPSFTAKVWPTPDQRFQRELGGPGQCLATTPYSYKRAAMIAVDQREERMTIYPSAPGEPLRLDHAKLGGMHRLTPTGDASSKVLTAHGC